MREPYAWSPSDLDFSPEQRLKLASRALKGVKSPQEYLLSLRDQYGQTVPEGKGYCSYDMLKDAAALALVGDSPDDTQIAAWKESNFQFGLVVERYATRARQNPDVALMAKWIRDVMEPALPDLLHGFNLSDRSHTFSQET